MAASTVIGQLLSPATVMPTSAQVTVTLVDYDDTPVLGFDTADSAEVISTTTLTPAPNGGWTLQLVPNADIELGDGAALTAYRVTESGAGALYTFWIIVTASDTPLWVGTLRTTLVGTSGGTAANMAIAGALTVGGEATFSGAVAIPSGASAGDVLTSDAEGNATWQNPPGGVPASTVQPGTSYGTPSAVGTATHYAREDHQHGTPALTTTAPATTEGIGQGAAVGTASLPARADHVHPMAAAGAPGSSAVGDTPATGTATTPAASDHRHGRESFGTVTALTAFNTSSANGSASTPSRSDHVHGAPALPTGTTAAAGIVQIDGTAADFQPAGTAAAGSVGKVADAGHVHPGPSHQFSVLAYGAKGDGKISNTGATTASSTTVTIGESVLASGDVGKVVMVKNALQNNSTAGQTTSVGTITAVNSATSFTATWNTTPTQTSTGLQVLWATDDTAAIQAAIAAANTYALAHAGFAEIYFPVGAGLYYGVGGPLKSTDGVNAVYNSQLTIPVNAETNPGVTLTFRGVGGGGNPRYWNSDSPQFGGGIQSFGCFTGSSGQSSSITGGGNPSVIGGPTGKFGYGVVVTGTTPTFSNTCVEFRNFTIRTTHSNSGWTYSAANMFGVARFHAYDFTCGTNGTVQFYKYTPSLGDFTNVTLLSGGTSIGVIMPSNGNNASNYLQNFVIDGGYTFGLFAMEHTVGNSVTILYCWGGFCPVGNYGDSGSGAASALHAIAVDQGCVEGCTYAIDIVGAGQSGIGPIVHMVLDTEGTVQMRDAVGGTLANTGAGLAAALGTIKLVGSPSTITISTGTGAGGLGTGLQITKEQNLPGVPSSGIPALVDGTAVSNTLWRAATVYLSGGTNVTTVATSRLAGGVNTVAVSTVISQAAGPIPANTPIRLGPGQWIKVTTSSGTLPSAVWVLD